MIEDHPLRIHHRSATPDDREFVLDLAATAFERLGDYRTILAGWFDHEGVQTTIAEADRPVGFAMLAFVRGELDLSPVAELVAIAVEPAWRRRGLARMLLDGAIGAARAQADQVGAHRRIALTVAEDNPAAQALFASAGFARRPRGDGRYPSGHRYLRLERPLTLARVDRPPDVPPPSPAVSSADCARMETA